MPSFRTFRTSVAASACIVLSLGACTHVNLNAPPVEDWSDTRSVPAARPPAAAELYTVQRNDTLASIAARVGTTAANLAAWNNLAPNARVTPNQVLRIVPPNASGIDGGPVATTSPIGSEGVEQRPLGQGPVTSTAIPPAGSSASAAPLKTGPLGVKKPYSDATLADLSRPDGDAPSVGTAMAPTAPPAPVVGSSITWAWPTTGNPSTSFGNGATKGIDIPGKAGDPVLAAADGKITFSSAGVRGYGNFIIIRHSPELLSVYAHNRANLVKEGDTVTRGQKIAEMGNTESDSVKLHFEIRSDSKPVDPLRYLPAR